MKFSKILKTLANFFTQDQKDKEIKNIINIFDHKKY